MALGLRPSEFSTLTGVPLGSFYVVGLTLEERLISELTQAAASDDRFFD